MKPGKITHTVAALLSSITSLFAHGAVTKAEPSKVKLSKKSEKKSDESNVGVDSLAFAPTHLRSAPAAGESYPWKQQIVTTVFWIGEKPSENNPVPNRASSAPDCFRSVFRRSRKPWSQSVVSRDNFRPPPAPISNELARMRANRLRRLIRPIFSRIFYSA